MHEFIFSDRYKLELHWGTIIYTQEGICELKDAYFSGPALAEADKIHDNDSILLDFFKQYIVLVKNVYVAKFSWGEVIYKNDGVIKLKNAIISHATELNKVPKLLNTDYLIIDTSDHETETHKYNLVYKTYVVNTDTQLYKFGGE